MGKTRYDILLRNYTRATIFLTPYDFLAASVEYFKWCEDNPLQESKVFAHQGEVIYASVNKVRAFTKIGLSQHLGIPEGRLEAYKSRSEKGWTEAVLLVEEAIYTQKFENAAAGLLNATIISRDLGLADRQEHTGADGGPIQTEELSARERVAGKLSSLATRSRAISDPGEPE